MTHCIRILIIICLLHLSSSTGPTTEYGPFRQFTREELAKYNGKDSKLPILLSVNRKVRAFVNV